MLQLHNKHLSKTVDKLLVNQFGITKFMGEDSDINFHTSFESQIIKHYWIATIS